jgi:uncharacterized protein (TIGR02284 family)
MPETIDHTAVKKTLTNLINVLHDGHHGFLELEKHLKDHEARTFFLKESQKRSEFAAELENELHHLGVKDVHEDGKVSGTLHRAWGELKAKLGGGDHELLVTAEQGEDEAKKAYKEALETHLPADVREIVTRQQAHILAAHDKTKALRDAKVSA